MAISHMLTAEALEKIQAQQMSIMLFLSGKFL
jgi:hypothetical protein